MRFAHTLIVLVSTSHVKLVEKPYGWWTSDEQGDDGNDALGVECHALLVTFYP
jgi:hypothetical protein